MTPPINFTVRPSGWLVPTIDLPRLKPRRLRRPFYELLVKQGFPGMHGWLIFDLHSEFDPNRAVYDFHGHGFACGEMADALEILRREEMFEAGRDHPLEEGLAESSRLRIGDRPLENLPYPLSYILQSWHPDRRTFTNLAGDLVRSKQRRRIPEPWHSQWLVWMDQLKVSDLMFCIGMKPTRSGFKLNPRNMTNI